jgi:hypothetical protein
LLAVLDASDEDLYGYDITTHPKGAWEGAPVFNEGSLHPVRCSPRGGPTTARAAGHAAATAAAAP